MLSLITVVVVSTISLNFSAALLDLYDSKKSNKVLAVTKIAMFKNSSLFVVLSSPYINKGETHVIMGPNGAGKSTTANVILNNPEYKKTSGEILFEGENIK